MNKGLLPIRPHHKDYHFLPSFGATTFDTASLPENFSIYDPSFVIPNQDSTDTRFTPALQPLFQGCTAEAGTFACGLEDNLALYSPAELYIATPPGTLNTGRDIRAMLDTLKKPPYNRKAYFNVYAAGPIDDFDAARIALWINQDEKRAVILGSYWYPEFENIGTDGILPIPSFKTANATLHCWILTGWKTVGGVVYLEGISWQGEQYGNKGLHYVSRPLYNALINQIHSGAFTVTKIETEQPVTLGMQSYIDELVAFVRHLFGFSPLNGAWPPIYAAAKANLGNHLTLDRSVPPEEGCCEAVSVILKQAGYAVPPKGIPGVNDLIDWMLAHGFTERATPTLGCVVTAHSPDYGNPNYAHAGIAMEYGIASNNSFGGVIGRFTENYSYTGFTHYFHDLHGSEIRYFSPI